MKELAMVTQHIEVEQQEDLPFMRGNHFFGSEGMKEWLSAIRKKLTILKQAEAEVKKEVLGASNRDSAKMIKKTEQLIKDKLTKLEEDLASAGSEEECFNNLNPSYRSLLMDLSIATTSVSYQTYKAEWRKLLKKEQKDCS
mmetsp:Transcript_36447/g.55952  ORF Transcript_36447/g.55952 Transcript_36447/m.55952 type:complete len:141 (-) Transcript_36447:1257-1679(-)